MSTTHRTEAAAPGRELIGLADAVAYIHEKTGRRYNERTLSVVWSKPAYRVDGSIKRGPLLDKKKIAGLVYFPREQVEDLVRGRAHEQEGEQDTG